MTVVQDDSGASLTVPIPQSIWIDPKTGFPTAQFFQFAVGLLRRTGGSAAPKVGSLVGAQVIQAQATNASAQAQAAQFLAAAGGFSSPDYVKPNMDNAAREAAYLVNPPGDYVSPAITNAALAAAYLVNPPADKVAVQSGGGGGSANITPLAFSSSGTTSSINGASATYYKATTAIVWPSYYTMLEIAARIVRSATTDQPTIVLSKDGLTSGIVLVAQNDGSLVIYKYSGGLTVIASGNATGSYGGGSTFKTVHLMKLFATSVDSFPTATFFGSRDANGTQIGSDTSFDLTTGTWYVWVSASAFANILSVVVNSKPEYGS